MTLKSVFAKIWINRVYIAKETNTMIARLYAVIGFIGLIAPIDEVFSNTVSVWMRLLISCAILIGAWLLVFVGVGLFLSSRKRFSVFCSNSGKALYIQYGDLFSEQEICNPEERRNIVIPVNRCFDTRVDNRLVSEKTLHGYAFKKLYSLGLYSEETLNQAIQLLLKDESYEEISEAEKPEGNRKRYKVGTVIDLPINDKTHYLLWAQSTFDRHLKAHTSMQDYVIATQRLVESCNAESEGFPVLVPLVGTGLSRTKKGQKEVLSYLVWLFKLNQSEINSDIHIVVRADLRNQLSIMNVR